MSSFKALISCTAAACLLVACDGMPSHPDTKVSSESAANDVTIYASPVQVGVPYREVAVLIVGRDFPAGTPTIDRMRERAAALGANGIILDATPQPSTAAHQPQYVLSATPSPAQRIVAILTGDRIVAGVVQR
jgi:hypothetical protein